MLESTTIYAKRETFSFKCLGKDLRIKFYSGVTYFLLADITRLLKIDFKYYKEKIDNNVSDKYPLVFFKNDSDEYISIGTLMRLLADLNSVLGKFKTDKDLSASEQTTYLINQLYLIFK